MTSISVDDDDGDRPISISVWQISAAFDPFGPTKTKNLSFHGRRPLLSPPFQLSSSAAHETRNKIFLIWSTFFIYVNLSYRFLVTLILSPFTINTLSHSQNTNQTTTQFRTWSTFLSSLHLFQNVKHIHIVIIFWYITIWLTRKLFFIFNHIAFNQFRCKSILLLYAFNLLRLVNIWNRFQFPIY